MVALYNWTGLIRDIIKHSNAKKNLHFQLRLRFRMQSGI